LLEEVRVNRSENVSDRVATIETRIEAWKAEARVIAVEAADAIQAKSVDPERLVFVEGLAGAIYEEIEDLNQFLTHPSLSETQRTRLARVGDALRLVLLEITEQGTRMYSARSMGADPYPLMGVSLQKAYEILRQSGHIGTVLNATEPTSGQRPDSTR
jgi:hypothetical protein